MKKWFVLSLLLVGFVGTQDAAVENIAELEKELDALITPDDGNDTIDDIVDVDAIEIEEMDLGDQDEAVQVQEIVTPGEQEVEIDVEVMDEEDATPADDTQDDSFSQALDEAIGQEVGDIVNGQMEDEMQAEPMDEDEEADNGDEVVSGFWRKEAKDIAEPEETVPTSKFDVARKKKQVVELVERARKELINRPLDVACNRFTHTKEFVYGDLYVFVYDIDGVCLAHGEDSHLLWQNLYNFKDWVGTLVIQDLIKKAKQGGGWVTYGWHNATKLSYVKLVEKEGKAYVVGSGFFPHSKEEAVVNLVKGGVALFNKVKQEGKPAEWAFSRLSYPKGQFAVGNLYLYALDFNGTIMAQGERPGLIGSNAWDYKDENGVFVNREIVRKLKGTVNEGVWVEYTSKRALKKAYAEKVKGKDGTQYFIACGYYPEADREQTIDLVRKAYQFMKTHGKSDSVEEFSQRRSDDFRYGDLYIVVYDMKGRIIADGGNADNIGQPMLDAKDQDGFEYVRNILKRATKQGIWVNSKIRGSFQSTYAMRIDLGVGQYVITASYYPISKAETMILLVQSGASFLKANPREQAFEKFVAKRGQFRRGDLQLVAVDAAGLCYAYGSDFDLIWRNIYDIQDDRGKYFIQSFINESQYGSVNVKTHLNNATKHNFVTSVEKGGKTYVVASGYYS